MEGAFPEAKLQQACRTGDVQTLESALASDPELINRREKTGWTLLFRCVACNQPDAVSMLLSKGADPNIQNCIGETALHQAVDGGFYEAAECLLKSQADCNVQNHEGETPLHLAVVKEEKRLVGLLMRNHADPFVQTKSGFTAIDLTMDEELREILTDANKEEQQSPLLEPNTEPYDEIPPIPQKSFEHLSLTPPSSRRNSEAFPDLHSEKSAANTPKRIETGRSSNFEPDAEKVDVSMRVHTQEPAVTSSVCLSPQTDERALALIQWLRQLHLDDVIKPLIEAGFDDLEQLLAEMKRQPIPPEQLVGKIGVGKIGYAMRLLAAVELEQSTQQEVVGKEEKAKVWGCCAVPDVTGGVSTYPPLHQWLEELGLPTLLPNFVDNGYTELDQLLMVMRSKYAFTDASLEADLQIPKPGHRHRILSKLREDCATYEPPIRRMLSRVRMERGEVPPSCEFCCLM